MSSQDFPVHPELTVHSGQTIYRSDEWWKAAVLQSFDGGDPEIAIYLWHLDDEWTRKNKYQVKTADAWNEDQTRIKQYLAADGDSVEDQTEFPVSDYYRISHGETVFKTDRWWKAIVTISQKGSYETQEVIIYLWQNTDSTWRRRQKYAIKDADDWEADRRAVDELLAGTTDGESTSETTSISNDDGILADIEADIKDFHLGSGISE